MLKLARMWCFLRTEIEAFYDDETREFTLSAARDLWRTLIVFFVAIIFHLLVKVSSFRPLVNELLEVMDDVWVIVTIGYGVITFLGKLFSRKKP